MLKLNGKNKMRFWTYILPFGLWLYILKRHGERMSYNGPVINGGNGILIIDKEN